MAMEPAAGKPGLLRNAVIRVLLISVLVILFRFVYVVAMRGESCDLGDFCFFALPENFTALAGTSWLDVTAVRSTEAIRSTSAAVPGPSGAHPNLWTTKSYRKAVQFYSSVFGDLISEGFLSPSSKSLCLDTPTGQDVFALKEAGVPDAVGIAGRASKPLLIKGQAHRQPFGDNSFDFVFSGAGAIDRSPRPGDFASEVGRTLRPEGFAVVHTASRDTYSFNSLINLFNCCILIRSRDMDGFDSSMPLIREIVMKKQVDFHFLGYGYDDLQLQLPGDSDSDSECSVPGYKHELVRNAEALIAREPSKPWITLKQNIKNIRYLPSMADISFKQRYIYIDVGARSYGSSIVSWFKKHYPKQNKTFEIYAIEADGTFHEQYRGRKGVTLLPYAAWVRNETLFFEINGVPGDENLERGRGMGRIRPVQAAGERASAAGVVDEIHGFDFAEWLKQTVRERDFVVMKMDVEGTEFDLIPRLVETGAICLIDELFLECHYNRWQKCCPGERSAKYQKTYGQCLDLFGSLRKRGVLVHQWW